MPSCRQPRRGEDLRVWQAVVVAPVDPGMPEAVKVAANVVGGDDLFLERREAVESGLAGEVFEGFMGKIPGDGTAAG